MIEAHTTRALFTTSPLRPREVASRTGDDCYSYYFVLRSFLPLLNRWATVAEVSQSPEGIREAVAAARRSGQDAVHLGFLPLQYMRIVDDGANVAFPFWEFPDIPDYDVAGDPRNNWVSMAERLDLILTACEFTRESFLRANVQTPVEVIPVPIDEEYFAIPPWQRDQQAALDCSCYVLPQGGRPLGEVVRQRAVQASVSAREHCRTVYRKGVRPLLPAAVHRRLADSSHAVIGKEPPRLPPTPAEIFPIPFQPSDRLELSGVVYTCILNPFDTRKNWRGIIDAFLRALADRPDATLVIKLAVSQGMRQEALHRLFAFYQQLRVRHRARLAVIAAYLPDEQMFELARASTYYVNASHAEGACLPLQDALAAGRPAIAPAHTAMAEYVDDELAFVLPSHAVPTHWQWDPDKRQTTTWQQIDVRDLAARFRLSYHVARDEAARYRALAACGRQRMHDLASAERVWARLSHALNSLASPAILKLPAARESSLPSRKAA
ncbi:MAG TPA: glycosyltransferase [Pirellulales bacterium]|jgi:glycosyltransferase involved in cell wall biosynthesis|nr:glycosyltransferase [Pirellulales bacterium]